MSAGKVRRAARALRRLPERLLHPKRRRQALRQLTQNGAPKVVLVVCHGNICRSPYAAALLRRALSERAQDGVRVESAGFAGSGRSCPATAVAVAVTKGVDLARHRSQSLNQKTVGAADLVVVMDDEQRGAMRRRFACRNEHVLVLGDLDPEPIDTRAIEDPVEQSPIVFERSYSRIERCVRALAAAVAAGVGALSRREMTT